MLRKHASFRLDEEANWLLYFLHHYVNGYTEKHACTCYGGGVMMRQCKQSKQLKPTKLLHCVPYFVVLQNKRRIALKLQTVKILKRHYKCYKLALSFLVFLIFLAQVTFSLEKTSEKGNLINNFQAIIFIDLERKR